MKRLKTRYTQLSRHGISLLEVMISIGILSIGLLASLSLIPAGRTLIRKADVENRSAAIIPNAMATMRSLGLFRVNAIDWQSQPPLNLPPALQNDAEPRAFRRTGWVEPVGNPPSGKDTQSIETWFNAPDGNPSLSGGGAPPNERVWIRENGVVIGSVMSNATGSWTKAITLPPPSEMGVQGFAPWGPVNVATTFSFEAYWEKEVPDPENPGQTQLEKQPLNITVTPPPNPPRLPGDSIATAYKHYNLRRRVDREVGDTVVHLRVPEEEQRISNQTAAAATQLEFPAMGETVDTARLDYVFKSRIQLFGSLWRWQVGTRDGRWRRNLTYGNRNEYNTDNPWEPAPGNFNYFPATDPDGNPGSRWVDAEQGEPQDGPDAVLEDDVDWFRIEVEAGQTLSLDWSQTAPDAREHSFSKHNDSIGGPPHLAFPLYFNANGEDESRLLPPADTGPASAVYAMPGDGYVLTRVKLRPAKLDEHGNVDRDNGVQDPLDDDYPHRINTNPQYLIDMTLYRNDRVVAIDPIMCARLDWIVDRFPGSLPHRLKRKRFADFQQVFAGTGSQKSFVIPRLNWRLVSPPELDVRIAFADWLCRPQDTPQVDLSSDADGPSHPTYEQNAANVPLRRRFTDRMSWLLMLQPEANGSVPANWQAGRWFHAAIVVFEDRLLPAAGGTIASLPPLEGEHTFVARWNFADGMIETTIPKSLEISDEDIQRTFRTGSWVLLAPRQAINVPPIDDDTLLEWVEIQTADILRGPTATVVRFLPAKQPDADRTLRTTAGEADLIVLTYQGVVNVVTRAVRIHE